MSRPWSCPSDASAGDVELAWRRDVTGLLCSGGGLGSDLPDGLGLWGPSGAACLPGSDELVEIRSSRDLKAGIAVALGENLILLIGDLDVRRIISG